MERNSVPKAKPNKFNLTIGKYYSDKELKQLQREGAKTSAPRYTKKQKQTEANTQKGTATSSSQLTQTENQKTKKSSKRSQ